VAFSPDGKTLASGGGENSIRFWEVTSGKEQGFLDSRWVKSVAFSPDGRMLASGGTGNRIQLWDIATRKDRMLLNEHSQFAAPLVTFSPDGRTLASGGRCMHEIRVWDTTTGIQTASLEGHDEYGVEALSFLDDGKTLASVGHDAQVRWWDMASGKYTATLDAADWTPAAAIGPVGRTVAIAVWDVGSVNGENVVQENRVKLWTCATGKERPSRKAASTTSLVFHPGASMVTAMAFSPDGGTLATGSESGLVTLWDVKSGKERAALKGHTDTVRSLAFSPDGTVLASGSSDGTIKLWNLSKTK
jgi:WD40 repeat protein